MTRSAYLCSTAVAIVLFASLGALSAPTLGTDGLLETYEAIDFNGQDKPRIEIFSIAMKGYDQLRTSHHLKNERVLTIIDFDKASNEKRMWVIDLAEKRLVYHTLVAHGRNSGMLYANKFSNIPNSLQSSLGFYVTGKTYTGKHGLSLKLHGVEPGINDQAESRAIVMHGADYVSEAFVRLHGRLGRSFGCPAVPMAVHKKLISLIAEGSCLFVFHSDEAYVKNSKLASGSVFSASPLTEGR